MAERDPYAVVGVPVHASTDAVAAACRDLARRHHPDVSTGAGCPGPHGRDQRRLFDPAQSRAAGGVGPDQPAHPGPGRWPAGGRRDHPEARRTADRVLRLRAQGPSPGGAGPSARVPPARRRVRGVDRCSRSAATSGGPWARSHAWTPATSSGSGTATRASPTGSRSPRCSGPCTRPRRRRLRRPITVASRSAELPRGGPRRTRQPRPLLSPRRVASTSARNAAIRSRTASRTGSRPWPSFGHVSRRPSASMRHRGLEEVQPRERVRRPRAQQRRHRDPGPVGGPGSCRLGGARAMERIGEADEPRVAAPAPAPRGPPRPPTATRRARRTSARRRPHRARPAPAPRTRRSRPPPSGAAGSAHAPRTRGRAGHRPREPSWRHCRPRRDRGRSATCPPRYRADMACWYPGRPGRGSPLDPWPV